MADVALEVTTLAHQVPYRAATSPNYISGSFTAEDDDNHDAKIDARGKGRMSVACNNPANQDATVTVYGMHTSDGSVGDAGVFEIGSFTANSADKEYETINDPFPWYLIRVNYAVAPTDDPAETCKLYVNFSAF